MARTSCVVATLTCMTVLTLGAAPGLAKKDPRKEANTLAVRAAGLARQGRHPEAAALYGTAHELHPAGGFKLLSGMESESAGDLRGAADAYAWVVANDTNSSRRAEAQKRMDSVRLRLDVPISLAGVPDGADVVLDGQPAGQTPLASLMVKPGRHRLGVSKEGFSDYVLDIDVAPGSTPAPYQVSIAPLAGALVVTSNAREGKVLVDGREAGSLPLDHAISVPAGEHLIRLEASDAEPAEARIVAVAGKTAVVTLDLKPRVREAPRVSAKAKEEKEAPARFLREEHYVPLAIGFMPFTTVRSAHMVGMDVNWQMASKNGVFLQMMNLGIEGEVAPVPRWFSIGLRLDMDRQSASASGMSVSHAALRSVQMGVKVTPLDDGEGMALAVAAKGGIGNVHADGFEADYGVAGGGVMASVSVGPMRFLGAVGGGYQIPINKSLRAGGIIQWVFQPSVAVSGPHNIGASVSGSIPISEGRWVHLVDVLGGYIHGGRGLKTAILLGAPVTHREERMDFAIVSKVAWEF